jgi:hypothetical protein
LIGKVRSGGPAKMNAKARPPAPAGFSSWAAAEVSPRQRRRTPSVDSMSDRARKAEAGEQMRWSSRRLWYEITPVPALATLTAARRRPADRTTKRGTRRTRATTSGLHSIRRAPGRACSRMPSCNASVRGLARRTIVRARAPARRSKRTPLNRPRHATLFRRPATADTVHFPSRSRWPSPWLCRCATWY